MNELVARIKALLRRPGSVLGTTLEAGNVRLDTIGRELSIAGLHVRLWRPELEILEAVLRISRVRRAPKARWEFAYRLLD